MFKLLLLLITFTAQAQLANKDKAELAFKNIVANSGFENNISNWSKTGSATLTHSQTSPAYGNGKGIVDFSASGEFLRSSLVIIPQGMRGKNCLASFKYTGGSASIYYRVTDGTNVLSGHTATSTQFSISSAASTWTQTLDLSFVCPSSGSVQIELESSADTSALSIDDVYIGENFRVGTVQQANVYGKIKYAGTANCTWSTASGTFANFAADTDCSTGVLTGQAIDPGSKIPAIKFNNIPAGQLVLIATGAFVRLSSASDYQAYFRMSDGTNTSTVANVYSELVNNGIIAQTIVGTFNYSTAQGATTIQMQGKVAAGSAQIASSTNDGFEIIALFFPAQADTVVSSNVGYQGGTLTYTGAASCEWSTASASYSGFAADSDCTTPTVTGIVSATATKKASFDVLSMEAGPYLVSVTGLAYSDATGTLCNYQLWDGVTGSGVGGMYITGGDSMSNLAITAPFTYTSKQLNKTFEVRALREAGAGNCKIQNNNTNKSLNFTLIPLSPSISMPQIVNSVRTDSSGVSAINYADINCDASSSIVSQSGSWISSVGNISSGVCSLTLTSGKFTSAPICSVNRYTDPTTTGIVKLNAAPTISAVLFRCSASDTNGNSSDCNVNVSCIGVQ